MPEFKVDLTNCDREPIHIPGKVQAQGILIAARKSDMVITHASENVREKTGLALTEVIGKSFEQFVQDAAIRIRAGNLLLLQEYAAENPEERLSAFTVELQDHPYFIIAHIIQDLLVLEFEPAYSDTDIELQRLIGSSISKILEDKTLAATLQNAARQVKQIIGYDRVMIYKFWEDGHGEVIAEEKNADVDAFYGLHYPASDIPQQARELYKTNLTRIIPDVDAVPSPIAVLDPSLAEQPLDLTHSTLRAVSPMHIEYLKNMGVKASFSVSLVINDRLWGLIACHNYQPRFIDYKAREGAKLIGQILSSSIQYRDDEQMKEQLRSFRAASEEMLRLMQKDWEIADALTKPKQNLLSATAAPGAALVFEGNIYPLGETPTVEQIQGLVDWLRQINPSQIFYTDNLPRMNAQARKFSDVASGLLACTLSRELDEYILWFKPEIIKTVKWAGNPEKPVETDLQGDHRISPRKSFEAWSQQVSGVSASWSKAEFSSVLKLREDITHIINQKANQIRQLNDRLQSAYDELDTFSFTISHDLKTPLASVKNYTEILLEEYGELPEDVTMILKKIVRGADKMNTLINEVLAYSRIGRKVVVKEEIDMRTLLEDIRTELLAAYQVNNLTFTIGNTPALQADKVMIGQVFSNLLGNAVKYSAKKANPLVHVEGEVSGNEIIYKITDNGVGIDVAFGNQVFEIFKRLDNAKDFEGTGVGLSIVKRIIEKHHAKIWYESEVDNGTIFYLSFNK
jgi:two-component system, chemotaxis family, sensor kinase Cph1